MGKATCLCLLIIIRLLSENLKGIDGINLTLDKFQVDKFSNTTHFKGSSKRPLERVSRKQYEIINMLWQKTKIFIESDDLYTHSDMKPSIKDYFFNKSSMRKNIKMIPNTKNNWSALTAHPIWHSKPSTSSYIEFNYFDDLDDSKNEKVNMLTKTNHSDQYKIAFFRSPLFLFQINDATCRTNFSTKSNIQTAFKRSMAPKFPKNVPVSARSSRNSSLSETDNKAPVVINKTLLKKSVQPSTAQYDRVKFFEIYDSETFSPPLLLQQNKRMINTDYIEYEEKIYFSQVKPKSKIKIRKVSEPDDSKNIKLNIKREQNTAYPEITSYLSQPAAWADYPFIAVYVYDPEQVRCDCASISAHWLVSAATCLHRYNRNFREDTSSAFVSYCSNNWRSPGRISYVTHSFIHPQFHPRNYTGRQLYNIGVIQVVHSMSNTCYGWQPISLMSHQFMADDSGTTVTAVGWGLDRYDTKYAITELPNHPLMLYKGLLYTDSCPGNTGYSKIKRLNEASINNVYCLSLPPYFTEETDPVHGSLLLLGGKLIALYSQEERRRWGEQSAQYTGIWHLIPWINNVAREEDEELF